MALSVKVAMLICLGFTGGMCWLVSQVAQPMMEMPTPLIARGPDSVTGGARLAGGQWTGDGPRVAPAEVVGRFARPSAVETGSSPGGQEGDALPVALTSRVADNSDVATMPPVQVLAAPVTIMDEHVARGRAVARAEPKPTGHEASVPVAIIGEAATTHPRMLAALLPVAGPSEPEPVGEASAPAGREVRGTRKYTVRQGDTLVRIMRREWQSDDARALNVLLAANPQVAKRPDRIYAGEVLNIPELGRQRGGPATADSTAAGGGRARLRGSKRPATIRYYTIRRRDSLASIARRFLDDEERWREIAELNQVRNADRVLPGTRIILPGPITTDT